MDINDTLGFENKVEVYHRNNVVKSVYIVGDKVNRFDEKFAAWLDYAEKLGLEIHYIEMIDKSESL